MTSPPSIIGLIPARGGSQRVPRKNIAPCAGKPLLAYTCEAALASRMLDRTILSTDDPEIAELGRRYGVEVPFLRAKDLAGGSAMMLPVVQDVLRRLDPTGAEVRAIVLLQPTSPLRTARHIDEAVEIFVSHCPDSVVSVVPVPHIFHPQKLYKPGADGLIPYLDGQVPAVGHRDLPVAYARNGPAVLVIHADTIRAGSLYGTASLPYEMVAEESVDIDTPLDFAFAEFLLKRTKRPGS